MTSTGSKEQPEQKYNKLLKYLARCGNIAIAFSGGVDSTFLLVSARRALGGKVLAITLDTTYVPRREIDEALQLARQYQIPHRILQLPLPADISDNPSDRCYLCKRRVFNEIRRVASESGFGCVADGSNADDLGDHRPGMRALREMGILSPLMECGLSKAEIRQLSRSLDLPTWDKPAYACLLTRLPHGTPVTHEVLERIEKSEQYLIGQGFTGVRVRSHGNLARIEVPRDQRPRIFDEDLMDSIAERLKTFGYAHVSLDLEGYRTGSLNIEQSKDEVRT